MNSKIILISVGTLGLTAILCVILLTYRTENKLNFTQLSQDERHLLSSNLLPKNDYNKLLNIDFQFWKTSLVCNKSAEPLLLVMVHSSTTNFVRRQIIRDTWGATSENLKIVFLVGQSSQESVNTKLEVEFNLFKDIVQGDFMDTYTNITYKHTMGMKYVIYHCPRAKYVLKIDDDVFVNTRKLKQFLIQNVSPFGARDMLMGVTLYQARTLRSYRSKWRISFDEYPHRYFPPFCRGMAILYSPDVLFNLYKRAQENGKYVKLDDVFFTGLIAESIGFTMHSNIDHLVHFVYREGYKYLSIPRDLDSYLFVGSELNGDDMVKLWNCIEKNESFSNRKIRSVVKEI